MTRWRGSVLIVGITVLIAAVISGAHVASSNSERVDRLFVVATIDQSGRADVQEVIDYDFGQQDRRGIYRDVPDLQQGTAISVNSPTAPDGFILEDPLAPSRCNVSTTSFGDRQAARICIGDPDIFIDGRHRYSIDYQLDTLTVDGNLGVDWMAVGDTWSVDIEEVEIHLRAPYELELSSCVVIDSFESTCQLEPVGPGHIRVVLTNLDAFDLKWDRPSEAVRIKATFGQPVPLAQSVPMPPAMNPDEDRGFLFGGVAGLLAAAVPAGLMSARAGRAGKEQGSAIDARYGQAQLSGYGSEASGTPPPPIPVARRSEAELRKMATVEYLPPEGIEPWQGGVLADADVKQQHQTAWLLQHAADGHVAFDGTDPTYLVRGPNPFDDAALDVMFSGRQEVALGEYDPQFAAGWQEVAKRQGESLQDPEHWVAAGESMRNATGCFGVLAILVGFIMAGFLGGGGTISFPILMIGCVLLGGGMASVVTSSSLRVRTPHGSALFMHVEGFRKFIQTATLREVEWAAEHHLLSRYSAWAVALGESKTGVSSSPSRRPRPGSIHTAPEWPVPRRASEPWPAHRSPRLAAAPVVPAAVVEGAAVEGAAVEGAAAGRPHAYQLNLSCRCGIEPRPGPQHDR